VRIKDCVWIVEVNVSETNEKKEPRFQEHYHGKSFVILHFKAACLSVLPLSFLYAKYIKGTTHVLRLYEELFEKFSIQLHYTQWYVYIYI
jgi:hypothetical protein